MCIGDLSVTPVSSSVMLVLEAVVTVSVSISISISNNINNSDMLTVMTSLLILLLFVGLQWVAGTTTTTMDAIDQGKGQDQGQQDQGQQDLLAVDLIWCSTVVGVGVGFLMALVIGEVENQIVVVVLMSAMVLLVLLVVL